MTKSSCSVIAAALFTTGIIQAQAPVFNPATQHWYLRTSTGVHFYEARQQAVTLAGYLVAVNNAAEHAFLVANFPNQRSWIGYSDEIQEGIWRWDSGETTTYATWCTGEPNNAGGNEHYAEMSFCAGGSWNDASYSDGGVVVGMIEYPLVQVPWQRNDPNAALDIDGVITDGFRRPRKAKGIGRPYTVNLQSALAASPFEIAITLETIAPYVDPAAFTTANGQTLNVRLTSPTLFFFNGGLGGPVFQPFPGNAALPLTAPPTPAVISAQLAIADPSHPDGVRLSQAAELDVTNDFTLGPASAACSGLGSILPLGNDAFNVRPLGFPFWFFGTAYTQVYVGSNGHVTFQNGVASWVQAGGYGLNYGNPMIAALSTNLNPSAAGAQVSFFADPQSQIFEVCWTNVPLNGVTSPANTFKITAVNGSSIVFDYDATCSATAGTVGLSAGFGAGTLLPLNLSAAGGLNGAVAIPPNSTPFEWFQGSSSPFDLAGLAAVWTLDPSGYPLSLQ